MSARAAAKGWLRLVPGVAMWRATGPAAAGTSPTRDRVVDLLRVGSLLIVVLGHTLMAVVVWQGDTPRIRNLLADIPALTIATWALQVMPLFFAAGAISNRLSYRSARGRDEPWRAWLWHRERRLVRPLLPYLAVWVPLVLALTAILPDAAAPLGKLSTQLLWFLGVYLLVIVTPTWQIRFAERGFTGALALLVPIVAVDLGRFHVHEAIAVANFLLVWFMAATLGLAVRDRVGRSPGPLIGLALGAVALNLALVAAFPYPLSMVGMPGEAISNMAPPTLVLALHAVALTAIAGIAWPAMTRWCARQGVWHAVVTGGAVAMTLYLWHLTALVLVTVAEHLLDLDRGPVGSFRFWPITVVHLVVVLGVVLALVAVTVPFEHRPVPWLEPPEPLPGGGTGWTLLAGRVRSRPGVGCSASRRRGWAGSRSAGSRRTPGSRSPRVSDWRCSPPA